MPIGTPDKVDKSMQILARKPANEDEDCKC
jgi:hypothetical protein